MSKSSRLTGDERAALRDCVLVACEKIIAAGYSPSESQLHKRFPEHGTALLVNLRDELRVSGRLDWAPDPKRSRASRRSRRTYQHFPAHDAAGRVPWEQRVKIQCEIRAQKIAQGEPLPLTPGLSLRAMRPVRCLESLEEQEEISEHADAK